MSFKINVKEEKEKSKMNSNFKVAPGLHLVKLVGIVELGTIEGTRWVYASFMTKDNGFIGTRMPEFFTEHSRFSEMLYALLGSKLDELEEVNFSKIIADGVFCYINVEEFETPDGRKGNRITEFSYANGERFDSTYRVYSYSIDEAIKNIDNLPLRWLKESILQSSEWKEYQSQIESREVHFDETDRNPLDVDIEIEEKEIEENEITNEKQDNKAKVEDLEGIEDKQVSKKQAKKVAPSADLSENIDFGDIGLSEEEKKKLRKT